MQLSTVSIQIKPTTTRTNYLAVMGRKGRFRGQTVTSLTALKAEEDALDPEERAKRAMRNTNKFSRKKKQERAKAAPEPPSEEHVDTAALEKIQKDGLRVRKSARGTKSSGSAARALEGDKKKPRTTLRKTIERHKEENGEPTVLLSRASAELLSGILPPCGASQNYILEAVSRASLLERKARDRDREKAKLRPRIVAGLRQVRQSIDHGTARAVILARDLESIPGSKGIDGAVSRIVQSSKDKRIPVLWGPTRRQLAISLARGRGSVGALCFLSTENLHDALKHAIRAAKTASYETPEVMDDSEAIAKYDEEALLTKEDDEDHTEERDKEEDEAGIDSPPKQEEMDESSHTLPPKHNLYEKSPEKSPTTLKSSSPPPPPPILAPDTKQKRWTKEDEWSAPPPAEVPHTVEDTWTPPP